MEIYLSMDKLAYISVGSNLGNKLSNCRKGIAGIEKIGNSSILHCSSYYLTSPTDYQAQNWFVNAAVKIQTILSPQDLLQELISIQSSFGRKINSFRFGPRVLDLDIIFYENRIFNFPNLEVPHPRMHKRIFVLRPICDINSDFIHPILKISIGSILNNFFDDYQVIIPINQSDQVN